MKTAPHRKKAPGLFLFSLTILMILSSLYYGTGILASAESSPPVPEAGADFYYNDQANLLSGETKALILTKNAELAPHSIQLAVFTADTLPVTGYTQRVEYLRGVMQSWQVGGSEGRGLLLALSVSDGDYLAVAGEGIQGLFTTDALKSLLDAQLEPDFSSGSYDAGVSKFITEAASQAQAWAAAPQGQPVSGEPAAEPQPKKEGGPSPLIWVALAAGAAAVVFVAIFLLAGRPRRRRYGSRRSVHRHTPLVTPPRTNVLRHENHTPMIVKTAHRGEGPTRIRKL